jgi:orotidine-5'-phosphate decarboxylase
MKRGEIRGGRRIILALDLDDMVLAAELVTALKDHVGWFKIGKRMFTRYGPAAVEMAVSRGGRVFLDLKYHDIPNTVAGAVEEATKLGAGMMTIHSLGGSSMISMARKAASDAASVRGTERPMLVAVTVLTSLVEKDLHDIGIEGTIGDEVARLAKMAKAAGADGVVSSPLETEMIRKACGEEFLIITPGIRPEDGEKHDQKRTGTPAGAVRAGSDMLVIGRPILDAKDPVRAAMDIAGSIPA